MSDLPAPTETPALVEASSGPRVQRREVWVDLPPEYEGFKFRMWVNAPALVWNEIWSGDNDRIEAGLRKIVLEHNTWCDFDGHPYPPVSDTLFWELVPTELVSCIIVTAQTEIGRLPNSLAPKRRKSKSG